jgi:hypothetical protein
MLDTAQTIHATSADGKAISPQRLPLAVRVGHRRHRSPASRGLPKSVTSSGIRSRLGHGATRGIVPTAGEGRPVATD